MNQEKCRRCGSGAVLQGACVSCGAGVAMVARPRISSRLKSHTHRYEFAGMTYETGTAARREICTAAKRCQAFRIVEVE